MTTPDPTLPPYDYKTPEYHAYVEAQLALDTELLKTGTVSADTQARVEFARLAAVRAAARQMTFGFCSPQRDRNCTIHQLQDVPWSYTTGS